MVITCSLFTFILMYLYTSLCAFEIAVPDWLKWPPNFRDLAADFGIGFNAGPPPAMSREEFEARKADLRRKREIERRGER